MTVRQFPLELVHRPALGREDFLVSTSNAEAVGWIDRWPDWPGRALALCGPEASGKTHLVHVWKERSAAAPFDPSRGGAETFSAKAVFIDDADGIAGDRERETALFHLYNVLKESGGHLLLSGKMPPSRWPIKTPDLASRLLTLAVAELTPPDEALLSAVLVKQFADRQITVGQDVIAFLVARMERSFAAATRWVEKLDRLALAQKRKITLPLVREILAVEDQEKLF